MNSSSGRTTRIRGSFFCLVGLLGLAISQSAQAGIVISEWMYNGLATGQVGEYVELTNTGPSSVDMTGWSFDDNSRAPGSQSLSGFGTVVAGEKVILTDITDTQFRTTWGLDGSVKVIGGNANNLGRADEINIYDNSSPTAALVDRLTYDDQTIGGPRTNGISGNILPANYGLNLANLAVASTNGDAFGSHIATSGDVGNPGPATPAPEPASAGLLAVAAIASTFRRQRRRAI